MPIPFQPDAHRFFIRWASDILLFCFLSFFLQFEFLDLFNLAEQI